ncbi:Uncharacterized protein FWK35_00029211, partial [Aphis craccivora]
MPIQGSDPADPMSLPPLHCPSTGVAPPSPNGPSTGVNYLIIPYGPPPTPTCNYRLLSSAVYLGISATPVLPEQLLFVFVVFKRKQLSSQICTPDISAGVMNFIENGEFDEMASLIIAYFNKNLTIYITFGSVIMWGGEDTEANDEICVRAFEKFVWGDEYAEDENQILY